MDILDLENLLSAFHLLTEIGFLEFQSRKYRKSCQRNIKSRWYSPDLLICLICTLHLHLYCSQLFWPSLWDSCYFRFRSSYFESEAWSLLTVQTGGEQQPFYHSFPHEDDSLWGPLWLGMAEGRLLSPQQSLPDGEMLYSSLLKCWK